MADSVKEVNLVGCSLVDNTSVRPALHGKDVNLCIRGALTALLQSLIDSIAGT